LADARPVAAQSNMPARTVLARSGLVAALARSGDVVAARDEQKRTLALAAGHDALTVGVLTQWDAPLVWRLRVTDAADQDIVVPLRGVLDRDYPVPVRARLLSTLFAELEGADTPAALAASAEALALARVAHAEDPDVNGRLM
nr:hypothetical protein [Streptomyces sp. DSM 41633]